MCHFHIGNADEGSQLYRNALQVLTDSKSMPLDDNVMEKMIDLPELLHLVGSKKLQVFDVSMNRLNGEIPLSISNCNALKFLDLGFNSLNGSIPIESAGKVEKNDKDSQDEKATTGKANTPAVAEEETARLCQEFVESFQGENIPGSKVFVRGGTINVNDGLKIDSKGGNSENGVSGSKKGSRLMQTRFLNFRFSGGFYVSW
ncbi:hypothetical protein TEA_010812 [Camellia sinensis var. sinensis]|uniref:Uncharacterized protein n=1 Tax=Camellia sinensis var. sinensis TaxID=542762 RepID=A0A4S4D4A5_CAMSN|nr:hypothetical protein TEA_010812 [Camellia sinensis var. sinensis]